MVDRARMGPHARRPGRTAVTAVVRAGPPRTDVERTGGPAGGRREIACRCRRGGGGGVSAASAALLIRNVGFRQDERLARNPYDFLIRAKRDCRRQPAVGKFSDVNADDGKISVIERDNVRATNAGGSFRSVCVRVRAKAMEEFHGRRGWVKFTHTEAKFSVKSTGELHP